MVGKATKETWLVQRTLILTTGQYDVPFPRCSWVLATCCIGELAVSSNLAIQRIFDSGTVVDTAGSAGDGDGGDSGHPTDHDLHSTIACQAKGLGLV